MDQIELACPYCAGRFQAEAQAESRTDRLPALRPVGHGARRTAPGRYHRAPPASGIGNSSSLQRTRVRPSNSSSRRKCWSIAGASRCRSADSRPRNGNRYRRRLNLAICPLGMAILAIALVVLLRLRP